MELFNGKKAEITKDESLCNDRLSLNAEKEKARSGQVIDLSMTLCADIPVYPTDPIFSSRRASIAEQNGANVLQLSIGTHTGTHVDMPRHISDSGLDAEVFSLSAFSGRAALIELTAKAGERIGMERLAEIELPNTEILLIRTGWEEKAGTADFFTSFPFLTEEAANMLVLKGYKLIGCDLPSVDGADGFGPAHRAFLMRGIPIVEAIVNMKALVGREFYFCAVPLKIRDGDGSPVRAFAMLD